MKKLLSLTLILLLVISSTTVAFAAEQKQQDLQKLKELKQTYNLIELDDSFDKSNLMEFESFEEFEAFLLELKETPFIRLNSDSEPIEINVPEVDGVGTMALATTEYQQTRHYSKWKPYMNGTLFCWENIWTTFTYHYVGGVPTIIDVTEVDSDVQGLNAGYSYTHRSSTYNLTVNNTTCRVNTIGRGVFGISVGGFEVGVPHNVEMEDYFVLTND